jgi:hypothetical protein
MRWIVTHDLAAWKDDRSLYVSLAVGANLALCVVCALGDHLWHRETGTLLLNLLGYAEQDENNDISDGKTSHRIKIDVHLTPRGRRRQISVVVR